MIYTKKDLEKFLIALDKEVESKHKIVVIGGAAATLHYNSKQGTIDIDTYNSIANLKTAYERTIKKFPDLKIPLSAAVPAQGPVNLNDRLEKYSNSLIKNLEILIPEAHDWVLLKTSRCEEKDLADIKELSEVRNIDPSILQERFANEMLPQNPGNDELLISAYLYMISVVFGEQIATQHQKSLKSN
ncbi:MAG: DUF6036 family nucleotidyltransferase [Bdellovibrionota bacterium]